ncbi:MAG: DUF6745 domain-containing protein [Cyanobacteria bacterium P01_E01_bin.42]
MSKSFTPKQIAAIATYKKKWWQKAISTEPIDRDRVEQNILAAYAAMNEPAPRVVFCDSPYQGFLSVDWSNPESELMNLIWAIDVKWPLHDEKPKFGFDWPWCNKDPNFSARSYNDITFELAEQQLLALNILDRIDFQQREKAADFFQIGYDYCLDPSFCRQGAFYDILISVFNVEFQNNRGFDCKAAFQALKDIGGWILPRRETCVVCDRPRRLFLDEKNRPHAVEKPAIEYADGFEIYAYQGVWMPEEYGRYPPSQWQPQWLLTERNPELRRLLLQEIG